MPVSVLSPSSLRSPSLNPRKLLFVRPCCIWTLTFPSTPHILCSIFTKNIRTLSKHWLNIHWHGAILIEMRLPIVHRKGWIRIKGDTEVLGWNHLSCYKPTIPNIPPGLISYPCFSPPTRRTGNTFPSYKKNQRKKYQVGQHLLAEDNLSSACFRHKTVLAKEERGKKE